MHVQLSPRDSYEFNMTMAMVISYLALGLSCKLHKSDVKIVHSVISSAGIRSGNHLRMRFLNRSMTFTQDDEHQNEL
jgi:hypothetical protein